jgi:hypothetical protein
MRALRTLREREFRDQPLLRDVRCASAGENAGWRAGYGGACGKHCHGKAGGGFGAERTGGDGSEAGSGEWIRRG